MKAVRPFIASNGVPSLQMISVGSHSTSGKVMEGKKGRTRGSIKFFFIPLWNYRLRPKKKKITLVWRRHQLRTGFVAKNGHLRRMSRQFRLSANDKGYSDVLLSMELWTAAKTALSQCCGTTSSNPDSQSKTTYPECGVRHVGNSEVVFIYLFIGNAAKKASYF